MLATATAAVLALGVPVMPEMLVTYEKTGGFAGVDRRITVHGNGTAVTEKRRIALSPDEFRALRRDLDGITTLRSSRVGCDIADHFTYTLTYRGHSATRCRLPVDWRAPVARLEALLRR